MKLEENEYIDFEKAENVNICLTAEHTKQAQKTQRKISVHSV